MIRKRLTHDRIPSEVIRHLADRDAALWVGDGYDSDKALDALRQLIGLPWRLVLCEPRKTALAAALGADDHGSRRFDRQRGGIHVIASDPKGQGLDSLPPRSLAVFLLNGRDDATDPEESSVLSTMASQRRRLNMIDELILAKPRTLVVVGSGENLLDDVFALWDEGFRSQLVVIDTEGEAGPRIDTWIKSPSSPGVVDHCVLTLEALNESLLQALSAVFAEDRCIIRLGSGVEAVELDATECELVERPLLDRFELIQARHLKRLLPEELTQADFNSFFDKSLTTWTPYAAGLPWRRDGGASDQVLSGLRQASRESNEVPPAFYIASASGAGGTTLARAIAFDVAQAGYPTLVARPNLFRPDATEVRSFLTRLRDRIVGDYIARKGDPEAIEPPEIPTLIVFDVEHWRGREAELKAFSAEMARSGRPTALLLVRTSRTADELRNHLKAKCVSVLNHEISGEEAVQLGRHFDRFLTPLGRSRSPQEWQRFWDAHRPTIEAVQASFWIALEFWLKRHFDLSESVQDWLYGQFRDAQIDDDLRMVLLEIAALSAERQPLPEGLMASPPSGSMPYSVQLEHARDDLPALALVREVSASTRQWALLHDLLGRYLVRSVFFDRAMLDRLGLGEAIDPVDLRLRLLRRVAVRREIALPRHLPLALEFAVNVLKLGSDGNFEFSKSWRDVLAILDEMPQALWNASRAFNHHTAISRRRVVTDVMLFDPTPEEQIELLNQAIADLEYAVKSIPLSHDEDSDLLLLNSLALAYQNLAEVEREQGCDPDRFQELRAKATEAARQAQRQNPSNSYVLETLARDLIQDAQANPGSAVLSASEALGFIYQALSLDASEQRHAKLNSLAEQALGMLRSPAAMGSIQRLCQAGNPLGYLAKALLVLSHDLDPVGQGLLAGVTLQRAAEALAILDENRPQLHPLVLRFRYDLVCQTRERDFQTQLEILDDLDGFDHDMPAQLVLEHAILLHQRNRHIHARKEFDRLRKLLKLRDQFVRVPDRLHWLLNEDASQSRTLEAVVTKVTPEGRALARVKELQDSELPFIPQEHGMRATQIRGRTQFKCSISFGFKGPQIKPPRSGRGGA